jgi:hypothetical protein
VKRCPTCKKTFSEEHLSFCVEDGTPLVPVEPVDDEATVVRSSSEQGPAGPSGFSNPAGRPESASSYQAPGSYVPPGSYGEDKRRAWPVILGILALVLIVFAGLGIAAAVFIPSIIKASKTAPTVNANVERHTGPPPPEPKSNSNNSNSNSATANSNSNDNWNGESTTKPPTDEAQVLSDLTDLEHEWTAANINADKKKLDRILADDYVDTSEGKPRGKAEYLKTIKRDTSIQRWSFENLKASLKGDQVSLVGIIRLDVRDEQGQIQQAAFNFTDRFVWRDGRWQATSSEVNPLQE